MSSSKELAANIIRRMAELWPVDEGNSKRLDDGFDWWPGDFCVRLRVALPSHGTSNHGLRVSVRTDFLMDVPIEDSSFVSLVASMAQFATPTYAWAYPPSKFWDSSRSSGTKPALYLTSTGYLMPSDIGWLPEFLAGTTILQPINAQIQALGISEILRRGSPDVSRPAGFEGAGLDGMLEIADQIYLPHGQEPSRWAGSREFEEFSQKWAKNDMCFGIGDPTGLSLETPFGEHSILIRLRTSEGHPQLGHGLLSTLQVPSSEGAGDVSALCAELNFLEATTWTGFPQLGCWHPHQGGGDQVGVAFSAFIPNALYQPGLATNVASWMFQRARWLRQEKWPDVKDLPMLEILNKRFAH
jgi:hypothetical protein